MQNDLGLKLIAVVDVNNLRLFEAQGIKITKELSSCEIQTHAHKRRERHESYNQSTATQSSFYNPHTQVKDIERREASGNAVKKISEIFEHDPAYKELLLVSDPKMLGFIRRELPDNLKKCISKEVGKDLIRHDSAAITRAVFS